MRRICLLLSLFFGAQLGLASAEGGDGPDAGGLAITAADLGACQTCSFSRSGTDYVPATEHGFDVHKAFTCLGCLPPGTGTERAVMCPACAFKCHKKPDCRIVEAEKPKWQDWSRFTYFCDCGAEEKEFGKDAKCCALPDVFREAKEKDKHRLAALKELDVKVHEHIGFMDSLIVPGEDKPQVVGTVGLSALLAALTGEFRGAQFASEQFTIMGLGYGVEDKIVGLQACGSVAEINKTVKEQVGFDNVVDEGSVKAVVVISKSLEKFKKPLKLVDNRTFHLPSGAEVDVPFLKATSAHGIRVDYRSGVTSVGIPYKSGGQLILIDATNVDNQADKIVSAFRSMIAPEQDYGIFGGRRRDYHVYLPKGKVIAPPVNLDKASLKAHFGGSADKVDEWDEIFQAAYFEITEEGTEAGAVAGASLRCLRTEIVFDKPFFAFVVDKNGTPLFASYFVPQVAGLAGLPRPGDQKF